MCLLLSSITAIQVTGFARGRRSRNPSFIAHEKHRALKRLRDEIDGFGGHGVDIVPAEAAVCGDEIVFEGDACGGEFAGQRYNSVETVGVGRIAEQ